MAFPQVVGTLMQEGFESYAIDYRRATATYFLPEGDSVELPTRHDNGFVAAAMDTTAIQAAIRDAQQSVPGYTYAGFCNKVMAAGCAGYIVSFTGRRAVYFGRTAEVHVELFSKEVEKMGILLAFAPFIAFALVDRILGPAQGLFAGLIVSVSLLLRDWFTAGRTPKTLEIGTAVLFGGLALYAAVGEPTWSVIGVRLCVDTGLLLIVLISMAVGRPFSLQYAREQVAPEFWSSPDFVRTNYVITAAWALAFLVMVIAELALLYIPDMPRRVGIIAIVLALVGGVKFTGWYPEHVKKLRSS